MKKKIQKPFDAEAAKRGAKVETRNGIPVRIICYDREGGQYPILALVDDGSGYESCIEYDLEGKFFCSGPGEHDLVIVEEVGCPKFNVGDWIVREYENPWLITAVTSNYYETQDVRGYKAHLYHSFADNSYHLWTLDDAKSGDVLVCEDGCPFIFKEFLRGAPSAYCGINISNSVFICCGGVWTHESVRPATYEERQQLFNKLEEEGYKWDADSLTLSEIQKRWRDDESAKIDGYYIDGDSSIIAHSGKNAWMNYNIFSTEKQAKSALAMARISQIMANDERFGGVVTDKEWIKKPWTTIIKIDNKLTISNRFGYTFLAFHTMEQANLFLQENKDLIKDFYMMD